MLKSAPELLFDKYSATAYLWLALNKQLIIDCINVNAITDKGIMWILQNNTNLHEVLV